MGNPGMGGQPIDNPQLLSNLTNSDDPNRWLQYLMNRNGEEAAQANNGISGLLSSLFMSILTLAQELKQDESNDLALTEKNGQEETKEAASLREIEKVLMSATYSNRLVKLRFRATWKAAREYDT